MDKWRITLQAKELLLTDVLDKTGALMIRSRYVSELKSVSQTHKVRFKIKSPSGMNKLPSSYFIVKLIEPNNQISQVTGLFEYAYGAIRLVGLDNKELAKKSGDDMLAFFEAPLAQNTGITVRIYEANDDSK